MQEKDKVAENGYASCNLRKFLSGIMRRKLVVGREKLNHDREFAAPVQFKCKQIDAVRNTAYIPATFPN